MSAIAAKQPFDGTRKKAEIFLHCAVYCGAPAALDSFKIAKEMFAEGAPPGG